MKFPPKLCMQIVKSLQSVIQVPHHKEFVSLCVCVCVCVYVCVYVCICMLCSTDSNSGCLYEWVDYFLKHRKLVDGYTPEEDDNPCHQPLISNVDL